MNNRKSESLLLEITRKQMVDKSKHQSDKSKERFKRRTKYQGNIIVKDVDLERFYTDDLVVATAKVGDYYCTVAFQGVLLRIKRLLQESPKHILVQKIIVKAINSAIDESDLLVNCTCDDFYYRFSYWCTVLGYKWGEPQKIPSNKTNPGDLLGSCCKHLLAVLSNKKEWTNRIAVAITDFTEKQGIEAFRRAIAYDDAQFPSEIARKLGHQGALAKTFKKQLDQEDNKDNEEELKVLDDYEEGV